jgi:electron transfer flavoprotein alpha subunit
MSERGVRGVVVLAELDGDEIADASLRALTLAGDLAADSGVPLAAAVFTGADDLPGPAADQLAAYGAADVYAVDVPGYAPAAWARALAGLADSGSAQAGPAAAVLAAATDRGSEVLAHLGAITGEPVAANCVSVTPAGPGRWELVRQRWAGSLLEDAELEASLALFTVAADAVPARLGTETAAMCCGPISRPGTCRCARWNRRSAAAGCHWPRPGSWSAAAAGWAARTGSRRWRSWPACSAARSGCRGW